VVGRALEAMIAVFRRAPFFGGYVRRRDLDREARDRWDDDGGASRR